MSGTLDKMQLPAATRADALARCRSRLAAWGVAEPAVEPLVLGFGLDDFAQTGLIEFWIANELEAGYCGKYLFCFEGQACPRHHHLVKHETFFPVAGRFEVTLDQERLALGPVQRLAIEPGRVHGFAASGGDALLLELSMPCDVSDNYFENPRVDAWLRGVTGRD